jgi:hypothetical protein
MIAAKTQQVKEEKNMKLGCDYIGIRAYALIQEKGRIKKHKNGFMFEVPDDIGALLTIKKEKNSNLNWDYDILVSFGNNDNCRNGFRRL